MHELQLCTGQEPLDEVIYHDIHVDHPGAHSYICHLDHFLNQT